MSEIQWINLKSFKWGQVWIICLTLRPWSSSCTVPRDLLCLGFASAFSCTHCIWTVILTSVLRWSILELKELEWQRVCWFFPTPSPPVTPPLLQAPSQPRPSQQVLRGPLWDAGPPFSRNSPFLCGPCANPVFTPEFVPVVSLLQGSHVSLWPSTCPHPGDITAGYLRELGSQAATGQPLSHLPWPPLPVPTLFCSPPSGLDFLLGLGKLSWHVPVWLGFFSCI